MDDGSDSPCNRDTDIIEVALNKKPVADIATRDSKICVNDEVIFDGSASVTEQGEDLSYEWDFGDGEKGSGIRTTHSYRKGGKYHPALTVSDGKGTRCSKAVATAVVDVNSAPVAVLRGDDVVSLGKSVAFDGSDSHDPDGDRLSYYWDFGDGSSAEGARVSHIYTSPGRYKVILTVEDNTGTESSSNSSSFIAAVNTRPVPVIKVR